MSPDKIRQLVAAAEIAAPIFKAQGWTWKVAKGSTVDAYTPSVGQIAETLARLVESVEDDAYESSSGRLRVRRHPDDHGDVELFLSLGYLNVDHGEPA